MPHYTEHQNFNEAFIGFTQYARTEGLKIGIKDSIETFLSVLSGLWHDRTIFKYALASIYCSNEEERIKFDKIFERYWSEKGSEYRYDVKYKNRTNLKKRSQSTLVMLGQKNGTNQQTLHQSKTTSGANGQEALRKTDFALLNKVDEKELNKICDQLVREMMTRVKRKYTSGKNGQINLAKTIRHGVPLGGEFYKIYQKERKHEKLKLVLILDVSGSMDKYSFYLLKFIWLLRKHFSQIEAFTFSTRLVRITEYLNHKYEHDALTTIGHETEHWSSGTKIGECLKEFVDKYAKRILNGRTMCIILSDGLDTGSPELLDQQLARIKLKTKKLIWLNPLKGSANYQPIQKGMHAALPHLDVFNSAHNLESLLTLENIIANA